MPITAPIIENLYDSILDVLPTPAMRQRFASWMDDFESKHSDPSETVIAMIREARELLEPLVQQTLEGR